MAKAMIDPNALIAPNKKPRGRPRHEESAPNVRRMQQLLVDARAGMVSPSSISGRPLTRRGLAYFIWHRDYVTRRVSLHGLVPCPVARDRHVPRDPQAERKQSPEEVLEDFRKQAVGTVRHELLARIDRHAKALRAGDRVDGLRLRSERVTSPGAYRVARIPGLYRGNSPLGTPKSRARDAVPPTPVGGRGEVSREEALQLARDSTSGLELVPLTLEHLEHLRALLLREAPDDIAVAERVAELLRQDGPADTQLRRLISRASRVEFVHLGSDLGRKALAPNVLDDLGVPMGQRRDNEHPARAVLSGPQRH